MKLSVALCLSLCFCIINVDSSNDANLSEYKSAIYRSKNRVNSILDGLHETKDKVQFSTISSISILTGKTEEKLEKLLSESREYISRVTKNARRKGKNSRNIENCFNSSKFNIVSATQNAQTKNKKCSSDANNLLITTLNSLNSTEHEGQELIQDLDNIISSCTGENVYIVKSCVAKRLKSVNEAVNNFETHSKEKKAKVQKGSKAVISAAKKCNDGTITATKSAIGSLQEEMVKCLQNS